MAEDADLVDDGVPLRLRSERRFNVLGRKKAPLVAEIGIPYPVDLKKGDAYPLFLVADQVEGRTDDVAVATGEVELRKIDTRIYGDKMTYWPLDDEIDATGNVRMLQDGMEVNAPRVRMKMSEQIGFAEQPDYVFVREVASKFYRPTVIPVTAATSNVTTSGAPMMVNVPNSYGLPTTAPPTRPSVASGTAERAEFEGENQVTLFDTTYSTCKPGDKDWYLRASEMHLDYDRDVGDAKNATPVVQGCSAFLFTGRHLSAEQQAALGLHASVLRDLDAQRAGPDGALLLEHRPELRCDPLPALHEQARPATGCRGALPRLQRSCRQLTGPSTCPTTSWRSASATPIMVQHQQNLGQGFSAMVNYNRVSDDLYWQDMSSRLLQTSQVQLPQQFLLGYTPAPWLQTNLQVLRYQTLQTDPQNPVAVPYFLEPQINLVGFKPDVLATDLAVIGQYSRFSHATRVQGDRMVLYPQLSLPIVHPAFFVIPKVGVSATQYGLTNLTFLVRIRVSRAFFPPSRSTPA